MKFDPTITFSLVIAFVALISPIITAIINNLHQSNVKKLDLLYSKKQEILSDFVKNAMHYYPDFDYNYDLITGHQIAKNNLFIFFDVDLELLNDLETYKKDRQLDKYRQTLDKLILSLSFSKK